ncbi:MAG: hypothetical protein K6G15_05835 [Desulfovibrio sp.]|nr:hypothetical protein [Desulfovibrio sp.]
MKYSLPLLICLVFGCPALAAAQSDASLQPGERLLCASQSTKSLESRYLREARKYRSEGRYELARQSYVLALSICSDVNRLAVIRQELDGLEMLLRTLR